MIIISNLKKELKYIFSLENIIYSIKIFKIAPIIAVLIGGALVINNNLLTVVMFYLVIYLLSYLLNNKYRKLILLFYIVLLITIGFFINISNIYSAKSVITIFIILIFNFIFIDNILNIENNSLKLKIKNKTFDLDMLFGLLYVISYLNPFMYIFTGIVHIMLILLNKFYGKLTILILGLLPLLLYFLLLWYYPLINNSTMFQIITVSGFTLIYMFLIYSLKKLINKFIK